MTQQHLPTSNEAIPPQLERILSSKPFRQAKSLERFLRYVVAKKLAGEEDHLKEYSIGIEVFQRGEGYDPRTDAVVRVQANMLRKKLASYYEDEGATDEIIIALPKGHYVPEFSQRANETAMLAEPQASVAVPHTVPPARWAGMWRVAAIFAMGLLTAIAVQSWRERKTEALASTVSLDPKYFPLWEKFISPGTETILAYGTPQFFGAGGIFLRDVQVNSTEEFAAGTRLKALQSAIQSKQHALLTPTETYTGVGETHGLYLLAKFLWKTTPELKVTNSRMIRWQELKDTNVIFISSMRFHTLAKELPYPNDFTIETGAAGKILNLHPQAGEKPVYGRTAEDPVNDYAVITLWPGKQRQQRIMVLSGNTTIGTMAAAEYVTDAEYLRQLYQQLEHCRTQHNSTQHAPYFQVLVRTEVKDNQPFKTSYVTHHDLTIADALEKPMSEQIARHETR